MSKFGARMTVWRATGVYRDRRVLSLFFFGFSSGLPLALTGATLAAWLTQAGTALATIGFAAYKAAAANALSKLAVAHYVGNLLWAPLFFKLKQFKAALGLNVALVASLVAVLPAFGAVGAKALLLPYLAWLVFATVLNAEIVRLNPKGLVEANVGVDTLYS